MRAGAAAASAYHFVMPPLGFIFGWLLLGEHIAPKDLIGVVPIVLGIYLITRSGGRRTPSALVPTPASPGDARGRA